MLQIRFLGTFELQDQAGLVDLPSRNAQALLAYLLLSKGAHRREMLAGLLWPDLLEEKARNRLRYALWNLRKAIGDQYITADRISIAYDRKAPYQLDIETLQSLPDEITETEQLISALSEYRGELLPGFYDDWVFGQRTKLQSYYERKVQQLVDRLMTEKQWSKVIEWSEHWIAAGETPEPAYRGLIMANLQMGDIAGALHAFERCKTDLAEMLGVEPSDETQELHALVLEGGKPPLAADTWAGVASESKRPLLFLDNDKRPIKGPRPFVARQNELDHLTKALEAAILGENRPFFLIGEPGQGKSALLQHFAREAQAAHPDLLIAYGRGEAFAGIGDPYLPFRDILAMLTGDVESAWLANDISRSTARVLWTTTPFVLQVLLRAGSDLIEHYLDTSALQLRAAAHAPGGADWLTDLDKVITDRQARPDPINIPHSNIQQALFEQYTHVLEVISQQYPLLIILDDLHWADQGSSSQLFHMQRRLEGKPILFVGAYRNSELIPSADGRQHPLEKVLSEFQRSYGEVTLNLDQRNGDNNKQFVDAIIDLEENQLDGAFREILLQHTGGHSLFTIELLDELKAQGGLTQGKDGKWQASDQVSWKTLPARVEAVIATRVKQFSPDIQVMLKVAAIEGQEFSSLLLSKVLERSPSKVNEVLNRFVQEPTSIIEAQGLKRIGRHRLPRFRFRHQLFQNYLYGQINANEQAELHEKVGRALEDIYTQQTDSISIQLARHFEIAVLPEQALKYLIQAGNRAKRLSANQEATNLFNKALRVLSELPEVSSRQQTELELQSSLGAPTIAMHGWDSQQARGVFEKARSLAEQTGDSSQLVSALWGLWSYYVARAEYARAHHQAERIQTIALQDEVDHLVLTAEWTLGVTLFITGALREARQHLEQAVAIYDFEKHHPLTYHYGQNAGITCLTFLAMAAWTQGDKDEARKRTSEALQLTEKETQLFSLTFAHGNIANLYSVMGDVQQATPEAEQALSIAKQEGFHYWLAMMTNIKGWALTQKGDHDEGVTMMQKSIGAMETRGALMGRTAFLSLLVQGLMTADRFEDAQHNLDLAIEMLEDNGERFVESELWRLQAEIFAAQNKEKEEILAIYERAIAVAKSQRAKEFEERSKSSLSKYLGKKE